MTFPVQFGFFLIFFSFFLFNERSRSCGGVVFPYDDG